MRVKRPVDVTSAASDQTTSGFTCSRLLRACRWSGCSRFPMERLFRELHDPRLSGFSKV